MRASLRRTQSLALMWRPIRGSCLPLRPRGPLALKSFLVWGGLGGGERENNLAALIALDQAVFVMWALFVCRDIFPLAHFAATKYGHIVISKWQAFLFFPSFFFLLFHTDCTASWEETNQEVSLPPVSATSRLSFLHQSVEMRGLITIWL